MFLFSQRSAGTNASGAGEIDGGTPGMIGLADDVEAVGRVETVAVRQSHHWASRRTGHRGGAELKYSMLGNRCSVNSWGT